MFNPALIVATMNFRKSQKNEKKVLTNKNESGIINTESESDREMNETKELILNALGEIARLVPEQRMGQIIYNYICRYCPNEDCFYIEDKKTLEILEKVLDNLKQK